MDLALCALPVLVHVYSVHEGNTLHHLITRLCSPPAAALFYYQTNHLGFTPEFLGRVKLGGAVASLVGVWLFNTWLKVRSLSVVGCPFALWPFRPLALSPFGPFALWPFRPLALSPFGPFSLGKPPLAPRSSQDVPMRKLLWSLMLFGTALSSSQLVLVSKPARRRADCKPQAPTPPRPAWPHRAWPRDGLASKPLRITHHSSLITHHSSLTTSPPLSPASC